MPAEVIQFSRGQPVRTPIGHVIRTGETSYRQFEHLHAEGRLPAETVIVDASKARFQREFISALRDDGTEVILDTKAAELSEVGRFRGTASGAPWAVAAGDRPLAPADFEPRSNTDLYGSVARFAIEIGATAVMAPTHFLRNGASDSWFEIDLSTVPQLRAALDREGGEKIAIDYPLIIPHVVIQDGAHRTAIMARLAGLPFDNLAIRLSGFGASSGPLSVKRTLLSVAEFQSLGYPIMLDHIGGLVATGAIAFGFVSGTAHGLGERERFDARGWNKPPKERDPNSSFARPIYIPVPDFDRSFLMRDLQRVIAATGGRRLVSCQNRQCCPHGLNSMVEKPRAHIAYQRFQAMKRLFETPDTRRAQHFLDNEMRNAERKARDLSRVNTGDDKLNKALADSRKRIDTMARMFETLAELERVTPPPLIRRSAPAASGGFGTL